MTRCASVPLLLFLAMRASPARRAAGSDELRINGHINAAIAAQMHDAP